MHRTVVGKPVGLSPSSPAATMGSSVAAAGGAAHSSCGLLQKDNEPVSLADLLERRSHGLTEPETWALLCQAVQALQDLFLSDSGSVGRCVPLVTPGSLLVTCRGRVTLQPSRRLTASPPQTAYLAPEYRHGRLYTDNESEKMWIFSLGETLTRTALTSHRAVTQLSPALCRALTAMTRRNPAARANLMCLLDVISDYCKSRVQTKPFSHIVMDLHREVIVASSGSSSRHLNCGMSVVECPNSVTSAMSSPWIHPSQQNANIQNKTTGCLIGSQFSPFSNGTHNIIRNQNSTVALQNLPQNKVSNTGYNQTATLKRRPYYNSEASTVKYDYYSREPNIVDSQDFNRFESAYGLSNELNTKVLTEHYSSNSENETNTINGKNYQDIKYLTRNSLTSPKRFENRVSSDGRYHENPRSNDDENDHRVQWNIRNEDGTRNRRGCVRVKTKRNPVQRAASRLYKAGEGVSSRNRGCIGPEFVVRASLPNKQLSVGECKPAAKRIVTIILLNGQKIDIYCDPNSTTAGQIFEAVIQAENLQENFMLGLSALMSGDFIFLPSDTRVSKVTSNSNGHSNVTLFVRVRLFLPSLRGLRCVEARHLLYLQLRRSVLEQQLPCSIKNLITLGGFALQAEFGDFRIKEHGTTDYFLLEHYVPETFLNEASNRQLREVLTRTHRERHLMSRDKAEEEFIQHAQSLPHYGGHFYAATWVTKDAQNDVWLCVTARGISLYDRKHGPPTADVSPCQAFEWRSIQTLCYSKHFLCVLPHSGGKHSRPSKCKLKMDHKKSYFTFRLASLHHQFFLRLRREYCSLQSLAQEFGVPLKEMKNETNALCKMNPISDAEDTQFKISLRTSSISSHDSAAFTKQKCRRSKSATEIRILNDNMQLEEFQNKENENPHKQFGSLNRDVRNALVLESSFLSSVQNVPLFNRERRQGVLMGTRAIGSNSFLQCDISQTLSGPDEQDLTSLQSPKASLEEQMTATEAYVLNSSIRSTDEKFLPDFHETISDSLLEKFEKVSFIEERMLQTIVISRNSSGSLGLQITEGSDGNVYVQAVIPGGPAEKTNRIFKGDQIVAVNGQSLLNLRYDAALEILKNTGHSVEFIVSQACSQNSSTFRKPKTTPNKKKNDLYKSCLNLNHFSSQVNLNDQSNLLYKSCIDISNLSGNSSNRLNCSSSFLPYNNFNRISTVDQSAINLVNLSNTFADNMNLMKNRCKSSGNVSNKTDKSLLVRNIDNTEQNSKNSSLSDISDKNLAMDVKPMEKMSEKLSYDRSKYFHFQTATENPLENSYLKHIRYESTAEINGIYSNALAKNPSENIVSKSLGTLNDPKLYVSDNFNLNQSNKSEFTSCKSLNEQLSSDFVSSEKEKDTYDNSYLRKSFPNVYEYTKNTTQKSDAKIVDAIPKISKKFEDFLYKNNDNILTNHKTLENINNISDEYPEEMSQQSQFKKIAVPRSLGLGRRWKGPVKYPVTPSRVEHTNSRGGSAGTSEEEYVNGVTTSDDEQVFI